MAETPTRRAVTQRAPAELVEQAVALVRQSAAVDEARLDAFLDGAIVAAEQVQDTRLTVLEQPAEVSAADLWVEIAVGLLIDSKLASKALSAIARKVFGGVAVRNAVFLAMPKSASGRALANLSREVSAIGLATRGAVLSEGLPRIAGTASTEALQLYHAAIQTIIKAGSELDVSQAAVKAVATRLRKGPPRSNPPIAPTDSAGAAVLAAALDYAAVTRLGIRFRAARAELFLRQGVSLKDLGTIAKAFDFDPLEDPEQGSALGLSLTQMRAETTLFMEALIWSRMYGFSFADPRIPKSVNNPQISTDPNKPFVEKPNVGPKAALQQYWLRRFEGEAARYAGQSTFNPAPIPSAQRLLRYFAAISVAVDKQGLVPGALTRQPPP